MSSDTGLIIQVSGPSMLGSTRDTERVKTKIERSKTACLQCRSRRSKCGAIPPGPCPYCIKARLPCKWPSEEDRPKRGRRPKRQRESESYDKVLDVRTTSTSPRRCGRSETSTGSSVVGGIRSAATFNYANPYHNTTQPSDAGVAATKTTGNRISETTPLPHTSNLPAGLSRPQGEDTIYRDLFDLFATLPISPSSHNAELGPAVHGLQYNFDRPPVSEVSELNLVGGDLGQADTQQASVPIASNSNGVLPTDTRAPVPTGSLNQWRRSHQPSTWNAGDVFSTWSQDSQNKTMTPMPENDIGPHPWAFTPAPSQPAQTLYQMEFDSQGFPSEAIIQQLLDVFYVHFSCQFPFITLEGLEYQFVHGRRSLFLFYAIAAVSARFSTHPEIALPHLQPHTYGQVFYEKAISLVGSSMGVPSRENIFAFVLLTLAAFGNDSEVQVGILAGIAVRLTLQMDLHLKPSNDSKTSEKDCRINRLLFWSVLMLDYTLCFGERRATTIMPDAVTQDLPSEADLHPLPAQQEGVQSNTDEEPEEKLRSPFPYAAQTMFALGALHNLLLAKGTNDNEEQTAAETKLELDAAWEKIARQYDALPLDMIWTAGNLQWHYRAHSGPMYLSLHLWNYTIQAFRYLADTPRSNGEYAPSGKADQQVPLMSIQAESWLHCARFIGEILVLADVIDPNLYLAIPLVSHCFYEAVCCFAKDKEIGNGMSTVPRTSTSQTPSSPNSTSAVLSENGSPQTLRKEQSRKLFAVITVENIATIKQGLNKQAIYWQSGIRRVQGQLDKRLASVSFFDAMGVSERLANTFSLPNNSHLKGWLGSRLGDRSRVVAHEMPLPHAHRQTAYRNHVPSTLSSADKSLAHNEGGHQDILSDHLRDPHQSYLGACEDGRGEYPASHSLDDPR
ncbi:hypothetical protein BCR39DRAFT_549856 [Naematelia encephala]|uniref:Zn(2)-C6 fungal-type domain-containing protein n=1 Tax=Naematelia encephala TaxID=71784 RepID=A0A1Y2AKK7_9TREE|nr:hypothetical protein BCR39DRAFT_549856 [Naematelia encephala]